MPGSAELKPGSGVRSPKPEPRWNTDRCAPADAGAAVRAGTAEYSLRLSAFLISRASTQRNLASGLAGRNPR
jgi:hypothetical protein